LTGFQGTFPDFPAGAGIFRPSSLQRQQEQQLTFNMHGNFAPSLLETLYPLERNAEEFCYLLLRLLELLANGVEFLTVHVPFPFKEEHLLTIILHCGIFVNKLLGRVMQFGV
jgi:hypothetical protein